MKKFLCLILIGIMAGTMLSACGSRNPYEESHEIPDAFNDPGRVDAPAPQDEGTVYKFELQPEGMSQTNRTYTITAYEDKINVKCVTTSLYPELADGPLDDGEDNYTVTDLEFVTTIKEVLRAWDKNREDWVISDSANLLFIDLSVSQDKNADFGALRGGTWYYEMFGEDIDADRDGIITVWENFTYWASEVTK